MANPTAQYTRLRRLWESLPNTPMTEERLRDAIIANSGFYKGDWARASAVALDLRSGRAIVAQGSGSDRYYVKADEFPPYQDIGPGSAAFNAALARMGEQERERLDRSEAIASTIHADLNATVVAAEKRVIDEQIDRRLRELGLLQPAAGDLKAA